MFPLSTNPTFLVSLSFLLLLLSPSAFSPTASASVADEFQACPQQTAALLLNLKRSFGNPPSLNTWTTSLDCCWWPGVACDYDTHTVTELLIYGDPNVAGTIPPSISNLTNLSSLRIFANPMLSGTIPTSLCELHNLVELDLSGNNLTGPIPSCFGKNLANIDLGRNQLSGPIPNGSMRGVERLILNQNNLEGPIPQSLGDIPLYNINLSQNRLTGDASFLFSERKRDLEVVDLSGNELEFDMSSVEFPQRLQVLDLSRNKIYGSIPRKAAKLGMWLSFNVSYNDLCGPIPTEGLMKKFDASSFEHNKCLCDGPLEPCH